MASLTKEAITDAINVMEAVCAAIRARAKGGMAMAERHTDSGLRKTYSDAAIRADREADDIEDALQWMRRERDSAVSATERGS